MQWETKLQLELSAALGNWDIFWGLILISVTPQYYYFTKADQTARDVYTKFVLPPDVTCDRCVLQWRWVTGNSCFGARPAARRRRVLSPSPSRVACLRATSWRRTALLW